VVLTERRETTGAPESIKLSADRDAIDADGEDVVVLRVEALDAQGRAVPTADNQITFHVSRDSTFLGVGNGDPNCQESDKVPKRSLFNGLAQLIVQSTKSPGSITIDAFTESGVPKLTPARLTIVTNQVALRSAVP
jgi:beta-galactosidase